MSELHALGVIATAVLLAIIIVRLFIAVAVKRERRYRGGFLVTRWRLFGRLTVWTRKDLL